MPSEHTVASRLASLGIVLPGAPAPVASYVPCVRQGGLLYVSGQIPFLDGRLMATGRVPDEVGPELAAACSRQCSINALSVANAELATLEEIERVVRVGCFVACPPGFGGQPEVANAASDLLAEVFGDRGRHARAAVGCSSLPRNVPVEVEVLFALRA